MTDNKHTFDPSEVAQLANKKSQGTRPAYFDDLMNEQHFSITMALMAELAAARERIDTLERVLEQNQLLDRGEIERYTPNSAASSERQTAQVEYSARVFRAFQQHIESMQQSELSVEEMAQRLGETDEDAL